MNRPTRWAAVAIVPLVLLLGMSVSDGGTFAFIRGDIDGNGVVSALADGLYMLGYLAGEEDTPDCLEAADLNEDGVLNVIDPVILFTWGFLEGPEPADPYPDCGFDDDESLDCSEYTACD